MAFINDPNTPSNGLAIDGNGSAKVTLTSKTTGLNAVIEAQESATAGVLSFIANDGKAIPSRGDRLGSTAIASYNPLLFDSFDGATTSPARWLITSTTMAATQSSAAGVTINSGNITTLNTGYMLQSNRRFLKSQRSPFHAKIRARVDHVVNSVAEIGFFDAATFNGVNTTGAYWQVTTAGVLQPVVTYNSVDRAGTSVTYDTTKYYTFDVFLDDDSATFTIQDTANDIIISRQVINLPLTGPRLWSAHSLPVGIRLYNSGTAPATAPHVILTDVMVLDLDAQKNAVWPHVIGAMGRDSTTRPDNGTVNISWTNSAEPTSATLSNTAAGYTTMGGKFQFAAVAGAATDFALFSFQIPAGYNFKCTGIAIDAWNVGAAVATTPTLLTWGLAVTSTVSLASTVYSRMSLGAQSFPIASVIGYAAQQINKQFQTPIHAPSAKFFTVVLRMPVGTATASQIIAGMVSIEGYYE